MKHPYENQDAHQRWSRAVAGIPAPTVDPVIGFPFRLTGEDRVATAGSCFAQHIARHLRVAGFNYLVTEPGHPMGDEAQALAFNYGVYSARFGNIYTARQLLQLFYRVYGRFKPQDDIWRNDGRVYDPFRPAVEPGGFADQVEYQRDRALHFAAVRAMFEQLTTFVFTLGLTECWENVQDGAIYPTCPGTIAGQFDPAQHRFKNFTVNEVVTDLSLFVEALERINPAARVILTVSPVPLAATALNQHVLVATSYSKAVLRVAAEMVVQRNPRVGYFPSYEIITGNFSRGGYYADNLRDVTEEGVGHVMRSFIRHVTTPLTVDAAEAPAAPERAFISMMKTVVGVICEEAVLDQP